MEYKLRNNFLHMYPKIFKKYKSYSSKALKEFNLSAGEIEVLTFLINNEDKVNTARGIEFYRGLSKASISMSINLLATKGFIELKENPNDRRSQNIILTELTKPIINIVKISNEKFITAILKDIDISELEIFYRVNQKMIDNLKNIVE